MSRFVVYKVFLASPGFVCVARTLNTRLSSGQSVEGTTPSRQPQPHASGRADVENLFPCGTSPAVPPQAQGRPREATGGHGRPSLVHRLPLVGEQELGQVPQPTATCPWGQSGSRPLRMHGWAVGGQRGQFLSCREASGASPCPHRNTLQHLPCFCCLTPSSGQAFASHQALEVWRTDTSRTLFLATDTPERPRGSALWGMAMEVHGQAPGPDPRGSKSGGVCRHPLGSWVLEGLCADPLHFQMRTRGLREVTRLPEATQPTGSRTQS